MAGSEKQVSPDRVVPDSIQRLHIMTRPTRSIATLALLLVMAGCGDTEQATEPASQNTEVPSVAESNLARGQAFLEQNAQNEGVMSTDSGLQYEVITEGSGEKPTATSRVTVHYEGSLIDGTVFDSSYQRGETISFGLNQVISG